MHGSTAGSSRSRKRRSRESTHDGRHVVLGTGRDEHAEVGLAIVHAEVHRWRRLGLHVLVHPARRDQQARGVAVVPVSVS